ncbi:hypothetical protein BGZ60DRAFT_522677 [Tricladium varicosporioides]|nr:hypothetical protein BGZ60DRAFT_522677 [Hymenoscyphus varicosporioides]
MSIHPLPPAVIAQIKSSTTITSLNGVVCELLKNSFDAGSTKIEVSVDYAKGGCTVEDNGLGIPPSEFHEAGGLGKLYHSSKFNTQTLVHGGHGTFLASLSAMALLSITSHHHEHLSHNTISMHKSEVIARQNPVLEHHHLQYQEHGTRVTVRDLFGNMPVRVKQRAIVAEKSPGNSKDWQDLRRNITALLLSWPADVAITVREVGTLQKIIYRIPTGCGLHQNSSSESVNISKVCSILSQASFITPDEKPSWLHVKASTNTVCIQGTISLIPSATKHIQFISCGIQPIVVQDGQSVLHSEINRLFLSSAFGNEEETIEINPSEKIRRANDARYKSDGFTNKELLGGRKGVERWPMFYINIQPKTQKSEPFHVDDILDDKQNALSVITQLIQTMITEFLTQNRFRPKGNRKRMIEEKPDGKSDVLAGNGDQEILQNVVRVESNQQTHAMSRNPIEPGVTTKKGVPKDRKRQKIDHLGTDIKLPSFRKPSSQAGSPFDRWSKIKTGATGTRFLGITIDDTSIHQSTKLGEVSSISSRLATTNLSQGHQPSTPLVSSTGKLLRRPFEDVDLSKSEPIKLAHHPIKTLNITNIDVHENNDAIEWTNPITEVKSFVNLRTGFTLSSESNLDERSNRSSISSIRQSLRQPLIGRKDEPSVWVSKILRNWENPIFKPAEATIPQVSANCFNPSPRDILHCRKDHCTQIDIDQAFKESSTRINSRISKNSLRNAQVIAQVDKKFILVKIKATESLHHSIDTDNDQEILVIVDQHAADERIRTEDLMEELCRPDSATSSHFSDSEYNTLSLQLDKSLVFEIPDKEALLLLTHKCHFQRWGIHFDISQEATALSKDKVRPLQRLSVHSLPPGISERCKLDPRLLIDLIRTEAWKCSEGKQTSSTKPCNPLEDQSISDRAWLHRIRNCPQGIIDMLHSRACRSAIMFNDELTLGQCEILIRRLADCIFPFQCAHGRPSLVPLVDLSTENNPDNSIACLDESQHFGKAFRSWRSDAASSSHGP